MKNYGDQGGCYPSRPQAEADNTLQDLHNSSYDTKAEFNNCYYSFKIIPSLKTQLKHAYLHRSVDVQFIFDSVRLGLFSSANILQIADVALRVVFLLFLPCFQLFFRLVFTLETNEMSAIFFKFTTKTKPRPQVFSVNGALTCENAAFLMSFPR